MAVDPPRAGLAVHPLVALGVFAASEIAMDRRLLTPPVVWALMLVGVAAWKHWQGRRAGTGLPPLFPRRHLGLARWAAVLGATFVVVPCYLGFVLVLSNAFPLVSRAIRFDVYWAQLEIGRYPLALIFIAGLFFAWGEEIFFRGFLQKSYQRWGQTIGLLLAAICFAIAHRSLGKMVPMFVMGLWFGYIYRRSGSIWLATVVHFLNNAGALAGILYLQWAAQGDRIRLPILAPWWLVPIFTMTVAVILLLEMMFRRENRSPSE